MSISSGSVRGLLAGALAAAGIVLSTASGVASAQTPQQAIQFRKGSMQVQQWHLRMLVQMVKGQRPFDAAVYLRAMTTLDALSASVGEGFIPGSDTGDTRASPEIFKDPAAFRAAVERFQGESKKAVAIARSGDEKAMRAEVAEMIKSCDGCHERFRLK